MSKSNKRCRQDRIPTEKLKIWQYVDENPKIKRKVLPKSQRKYTRLHCINKFVLFKIILSSLGR